MVVSELVRYRGANESRWRVVSISGLYLLSSYLYLPPGFLLRLLLHRPRTPSFSTEGGRT